MDTCRFCNASFTTRQARWKHEKFRCLYSHFPENESTNVDSEAGMSNATQSDIDVDSSVSGQTVTTSKAGTESSSATELDQTDENIVKGYMNELISAMVDDSGDADHG